MNNTEPVLSANLIVAIVSGVIVLAASFGLPINDAQKASIIGITVTVAPLVAAWWSRRKVTPLILPTDIDGERLTRSDNSPALPELGKMMQEAKEMNKEMGGGVTTYTTSPRSG